MALRSIKNHRRSSAAWSIEGVTSQGKDRALRSLAYNLGTIASEYHLRVLSDAVFEVVSLREVGDAGIAAEFPGNDQLWLEISVNSREFPFPWKFLEISMKLAMTNSYKI